MKHLRNRQNMDLGYVSQLGMALSSVRHKMSFAFITLNTHQMLKGFK
jgi:hypothetical protein